MIIVKLIGGLGNQMFQYALGRQLAKKNNAELKIDIEGFKNYGLRKYDLKYFNIQENVATPDDLSKVFSPSDGLLQKFGKQIRVKFSNAREIDYIRENSYNFQPDILNLGDNTYLDGYWQNEKYFADIKNVIKKEFTVKTQPDQINESFLEKIEACESVSIHIRRGDYVSNQTTAQVHGFLGLGYYQKAIKFMLDTIEGPEFFVFTDEPEWAKRNIKNDVKITFIEHNSTKNYEDLRLLSNCRHHIIANSTFSWWGAWLSPNTEKIVIAPKKWFNTDKLNADDLILDSWHRL